MKRFWKIFLICVGWSMMVAELHANPLHHVVRKVGSISPSSGVPNQMLPQHVLQNAPRLNIPHTPQVNLPIKPLKELNIQTVNPGWSSLPFLTPEGRSSNCACATYATDLRLSGQVPDAVAAKLHDGVPVSLGVKPSWIPFVRDETISMENNFVKAQYGLSMKRAFSLDDLEQDLLRAGPGARAFVDAHVYYQGHRHAFNAVNVLDTDGVPKVIYLDGQRSRRMPKWIINTSFSDYWYARTDKSIPSKVVWQDNWGTGISYDWIPNLPPIPLPPFIPIPAF